MCECDQVQLPIIACKFVLEIFSCENKTGNHHHHHHRCCCRLRRPVAKYPRAMINKITIRACIVCNGNYLSQQMDPEMAKLFNVHCTHHTHTCTHIHINNVTVVWCEEWVRKRENLSNNFNCSVISIVMSNTTMTTTATTTTTTTINIHVG